MTTGDIYHITGSLKGRSAIAFLSTDHNDYVQVNAHAVARVAANDTVGTYSAWVNIRNITDTVTILGAGDDNLVEFIELNIEAGLLTARITDGATPQFITQADAIHFTPHVWYYVAMVQYANGEGVHLFVNGIKIASTNDTATDVDSWYAETDAIDTFRIGAANKIGDASVTNDFKGGISDVKYWNVALTADEVDSDYQEIAVQAAALQLHIDFKDDLIDAGAGADNGTIVGDCLLSFYSEFTSRLRNVPTIPLVADSVLPFTSGDTGHAIIIEA